LVLRVCHSTLSRVPGSKTKRAASTKAAVRALAVALGAALLVAGLLPYWTSTALILRAAGTPGWLGRLSQWEARPVSDGIVQIALRNGTTRARVFRPSGTARHSALLVSGVHPAGIDEPRLMVLARNLAATGVTVVTPEIDDLLRYQLTARVTDAIEDAAVWMSSRQDLFGAGPLAMIGVSFSGGLSIVAAGRPALRDRVGSVLSFGGHGNLPRVLRYLCTGVEPSRPGRPSYARPPHDYGVAIVLHQAADLAVPLEQVPVLRHGIETFLHASALARTESQRAGRMFDAARVLQTQMPEPSATLMMHVNDRNVAALGARLVPFLNRLGQDPSLSPEQSAPPSAPVYLLHGVDDNVIPAVETELLAGRLRDTTKVRYLLSGFLTHVDVRARPTLLESWRMITFWKAALGEQ
jgi:dienelactone hydrolase